MKVLVLDNGRNQAGPIREAFSGKKIDAVVCSTSNEFMAAVTAPNASKYEMVYINVETWKRGRCIYDYFGAWQRFESKPIVFYNADENFPGIVGQRKPGEKDRVLLKPSDIEAAIDAV
jgi:hypothetical protein